MLHIYTAAACAEMANFERIVSSMSSTKTRKLLTLAPGQNELFKVISIITFPPMARYLTR